MNYRVVSGFGLALMIGVVCRLIGIPLPSPPALVGAMVVVSMTLGYLFAEKYLSKSVATQEQNCGGPTG